MTKKELFRFTPNQIENLFQSVLQLKEDEIPRLDDVRICHWEHVNKATYGQLIETNEGHSLLQHAISHRRYGLALFLIEEMHGDILFHLDKRYRSGFYFVMGSFRMDLAEACFRRFKARSDLEKVKQMKDFNLGLLRACEVGNFEGFKLFVGSDGFVDASTVTNTLNQNPLHVASRNGHLNICDFVLNSCHTVDIDSQDALKFSPLMHSCQGGHFEVFKLLVHHQADFSIRSNLNRTLLHYACAKGHFGIVNVLLQKGLNPNHQENQFGWTPLFFAIERGNLPICKLLLENGAKLRIQTKKKANVFSIVKSPELKKYLSDEWKKEQNFWELFMDSSGLSLMDVKKITLIFIMTVFLLYLVLQKKDKIWAS